MNHRSVRYSFTLGFIAVLTFIASVGGSNPHCAAQVDDHHPTIASNEATDTALTNLINRLRTEIEESNSISSNDRAALQESLEKQFDSFISNFQQSTPVGSDEDHAARVNLLLETRDTFVDTRLNLITVELHGESNANMEQQAFFDICTRLEMRLSLNGAIVEGAPIPDAQVVVLMLPKMDCPGCAQVVRDKLNEVEGVYDILTSVEEGTCKTLVDAELDLDDRLDEFAKTVVQFEEWTKQ